MAPSDFTWHYSQNQFENGTFRNFKLMNILSADHDSRLSAEMQGGLPFFVEMYEKFNPFRLNYSNCYAEWLNSKGMYKAQTVRLANALNDLVNENIPKWDVQIQAVYLEKTPEYIEIFPGGRTAFQTGPYDIRISQLNSLHISVSKHEELKDTADVILKFYNKLNDTRSKQQAYEGAVKKTSTELEKSRVKIAEAMYQNLGLLMNHFSTEPEEIQRFWELQYITTHQNINDDDPIIVAEGDIEPESKIDIDALTGKFVANTELVIHNTGDVAIQVYTTKLPSDTVPGTTLTIEPDKIAITNCGELGAEENLYLMINNTSAEKVASYSVGVNHYGINQEEIK